MNNTRNHLSSEVKIYLDRIGYDGLTDGSAESLAELQEHHLYAVPYENFDILQGIPLSLEIDDLLDKIVVRRRGGYCFELNALFGWLLRELGYSITDFVARFWRDEPSPPPKRRHHVLKVDIGDTSYLCDVGVGGIVPYTPLIMIEGLEQRQGNDCYKLERDSSFGWMLYELKEGVWQRLYSFTEEPQLTRDFIMATYWCENAPESIFRKEAMVAIRTGEGRNTIAGKEFRIFTGEGVRTVIPQTKDEYREALLTYFGIVIEELSFWTD